LDVYLLMTLRASTLAKCLLAGTAAALVLATATGSHAGNWPFASRATIDPAMVVVAQASDQAGRLDSVEAQMRSLTGQVEQLTHQLQVLQDQLKRMQDDNEFRFGELEKNATVKTPPAKSADKAAVQQSPSAQDLAAVPPAPALAAPAAEALPAPVPTVKPGPAKPQVAAEDDAIARQLGAPPQPLGTLTIKAPPSGAPPLDLSTLANNSDTGSPAPLPAPAAGGTQTPAPAATGDPRADYDRAYNLINAGQYDLAEKAFRQFLASYPNDEQAADAQYWLGESLFDHGNYVGAAAEFKTAYTKYPNSKRAPDTLLKLGLSMAGLDYRDEACKMYALALKKYPQMSNALQHRVKAEQASASC
jgi:tol-pal system protein YbgF